jgi:hypothetical protein
MQRFLQAIDEVSASLATLDVERLEEIVRALEEQRASLRTGLEPMTPAGQQAAEERLGRLRAVLLASEQNLRVLRNLHERAMALEWRSDSTPQREVSRWRP